jgi:nucleotide-binding universal stress UspA family protein
VNLTVMALVMVKEIHMCFKRILVPLDGSELAQAALAPALTLAEALSADITLLRVVVPLTIKLDPDLYQRVIESGQNDAKIYLNSIQSHSNFSSIHLKAETVVGKAAESIINYAQKNEIDLIVMSSHGRSGIGRWVYGSIADKVLYQATCAVAIIHPQVETELFTHKRILVPLDGSRRAERALEPALMLAQEVSAKLVLLRVTIMPQKPVGPVVGWPGTEAVMIEDEQEARAYLQKVRESLTNNRIQIHTHIAASSVAESIIDMADKLQVDLIVMSSHGRSGMSRWVFGSVTEKTLRGAQCATLVIQ